MQLAYILGPKLPELITHVGKTMLTLQGVQKFLDSSNFDILMFERIQHIRPRSKWKHGHAPVKEVQHGFGDKGQCSMPDYALLMTELEVLLNTVGAAATRLKARLNLIYGQRKGDDGRLFSGLHETVLPLCSMARSIFDQLRKCTTKKASKKRVDSGAATKINGRPDGRITGTDMRHLLLLLPFLLFDLLHDEVEEQKDRKSVV